MSTVIATVIIFEAVIGIGVIYGWLHEDKVLAWENRMIRQSKDAAREIRRKLCERWLNKGDLEVVTRYVKDS